MSEERKPMVFGYSDEDGSKQASEKADTAIDAAHRELKIAEFRLRAKQVLEAVDEVTMVGDLVPSPFDKAAALTRILVHEAAMLLGIDL